MGLAHEPASRLPDPVRLLGPDRCKPLGDAVSGFTPGPWDYDAEDFEIYALETFETLELTEPNARLIAAAPDLLGALKPLAECEIIEADTPLPNTDSARYFITMGEIRAARAAISKATGEAK